MCLLLDAVPCAAVPSHHAASGVPPVGTALWLAPAFHQATCRVPFAGAAVCLAHLSKHASVWHRALQHAVSLREPWPLPVALDLVACLLAAGSLAVCAASKPMFDSLMAALLSKPAPPLLTAEHGAEQPRAWLLPSAAAALTVAGLQEDAAAIAAHHSKVHSALSFFGAESSHLKPYLAGSARAASRTTPALLTPLSVPHTVMQLCLRLSADCKKAIDALSATT